MTWPAFAPAFTCLSNSYYPRRRTSAPKPYPSICEHLGLGLHCPPRKNFRYWRVELSTAVQQRLTELWETPKTLRGMLSTVDHKHLGKRYIVTAMVFLLIGGVEALIMRIQLARPGQSILGPETYDQIFSMHGMTMIFWYASPILSGFSIYLIPLMIGARDLAFPRLNAFTYYAFLFSGVLLYISPFLGQSPHGGWFAYTPYTGPDYSPGWGMDFYNTSLVLLTIATTGGAINLIVTILRLRAPGMAISKMP